MSASPSLSLVLRLPAQVRPRGRLRQQLRLRKDEEVPGLGHGGAIQGELHHAAGNPHTVGGKFYVKEKLCSRETTGFLSVLLNFIEYYQVGKSFINSCQLQRIGLSSLAAV